MPALRPPRAPSDGLHIADAASCMVSVLRSTDHDVILWSLVDEGPIVGSGGCVEINPAETVIERLIEAASSLGAKHLIVGSRFPSDRSERWLSERLDLTRRLREVAGARGIVVESHILVSDVGFARIGWPCTPPFTAGG